MHLIPELSNGRSIQVLAYERSLLLFGTLYPGSMNGRQQDEMFEFVASAIEAGHRNVESISVSAVQSARKLFVHPAGQVAS